MVKNKVLCTDWWKKCAGDRTCLSKNKVEDHVETLKENRNSEKNFEDEEWTENQTNEVALHGGKVEITRWIKSSFHQWYILEVLLSHICQDSKGFSKWGYIFNIAIDHIDLQGSVVG